MEISICIDSLTECLRQRETGRLYDTDYRLVNRNISAKEAMEWMEKGWLFDWSVPHQKRYEVYELFLRNSQEVQGRIALKHVIDQGYTHVDIVEAAPFNVGKHGRYIGVGAHLFAIACKLSWAVGNEGYVFFTAKSNLVMHYQKTLHAQVIGRQNMYIDSQGARRLIGKYFKEV